MISSQQTKLPGADLPLYYTPNTPQCLPFIDIRGSTLPSPFNMRPFRTDPAELHFEHPMLTLRETLMLQAMNNFTEKANWEKEVFDPAIASIWKDQMISYEGMPNVGFSKAMADWCIDELRHTAEIFKKTGSVSVYNGLVQKSESAIPQLIRTTLKTAVTPLERISPKMQDWCSESDSTVLDLVHPSLYPLIYGTTRVLRHGEMNLGNCVDGTSEGTVVHGCLPDRAARPVGGFSTKFQWLPCNVEFGKDSQMKITSYINNLHPRKHLALYSIIADIISCCIPLWNETLTVSKAPKRVRIPFDGYDLKSQLGRDETEPRREEGESEEGFRVRLMAWQKRVYPVIQPEPLGKFSSGWRERPECIGPHWHRNVIGIAVKSRFTLPPIIDLKAQFFQDGIQVIVKLMNIQLTPDKPKYGGETWHIDGQMNEHICASAVYYYDVENITESKLRFQYRCPTEVEVDHPSKAHHWLYDIYGMRPGGIASQIFGSLKMVEGRLVTFPNTLPRQFQPFELADPTKPGHCKILTLCLVDPNIRVISTAEVPCQRQDWWYEAFMSGPDALGKGLNRLPVELQEKILDLVDFPISWRLAQNFRLELMNEQKHFNSSIQTHDARLSPCCGSN